MGDTSPPLIPPGMINSPHTSLFLRESAPRREGENPASFLKGSVKSKAIIITECKYKSDRAAVTMTVFVASAEGREMVLKG